MSDLTLTVLAMSLDPVEQDLVDAWWCAANLRLYVRDRGERTINVGSAVEPPWVPRREAFLDLYARQILVMFEADHGRLAAAAVECRRRAREGRRLRAGWKDMRERRAHAPWRRALNAMTPWERPAVSRDWALAAGICGTAADWIEQAGAGDDERARAGLLAGTRLSTASES